METTFGFFPAEALRNQSGLPVTDDERRWFDADTDFCTPLDSPPDTDCAAIWPGDKLRMIDRVTGRWTDDGLRYRAQKLVDPAEWFFKAHFYQDPVMPGSLGVEAMLQTLRFALVDQQLHRRFKQPVIEPLATGEKVDWTYRGQVLPENEQITVLLEVTDIDEAAEQTTIVADTSLWVDGTKIYAANHLALRVTSDDR